MNDPLIDPRPRDVVKHNQNGVARQVIRVGQKGARVVWKDGQHHDVENRVPVGEASGTGPTLVYFWQARRAPAQPYIAPINIPPTRKRCTLAEWKRWCLRAKATHVHAAEKDGKDV